MKYKVFNDYFCKCLLILDSFLIAFRTVISFSYVNLGIITSLITVFVYASVFLILLLSTYQKRELLFVFLLFVLALLIYAKSKSLIPFYTIMFLVAAKNKRLEKIFFAAILGSLLALFYVFSSYFLGKIKTSTLDGGNSLGLVNPNVLSFYLTFIVLLYCYLRFEKLSYLDFLFLLSNTFIVYLISKSNSGLLVQLVLFFVLFFVKTSLQIKDLFNKFVFYVVLFLFLFCLAGIGLTKIVPFFTKVNTIITGRFGFAQIYILVYGIHLFGTNISNIDDFDYGHLVLDNGYARLLINYGVFYIALFVLGMLCICKSSKQETKNKLVVFVTMLGLVTETFWIPVTTNIALLVLSGLIFQDNKSIKKEKKYIRYLIG